MRFDDGVTFLSVRLCARSFAFSFRRGRWAVVEKLIAGVEIDTFAIGNESIVEGESTERRPNSLRNSLSSPVAVRALLGGGGKAGEGAVGSPNAVVVIGSDGDPGGGGAGHESREFGGVANRRGGGRSDGLRRNGAYSTGKLRIVHPRPWRGVEGSRVRLGGRRTKREASSVVNGRGGRFRRARWRRAMRGHRIFAHNRCAESSEQK